MRRACSTVEIHFGVALDEAVEEESGEALGLGVGAEAGIEVGGIGFDDEDDGGRVGWRVGAGGEEVDGKEKRDGNTPTRSGQAPVTEGRTQRTQRTAGRSERKKEKRN